MPRILTVQAGALNACQEQLERRSLLRSRIEPSAPRIETSGVLSIPSSAPWTLGQLERRYILHVLQQEKGNQSRAAERLGIDRRTLYRKLKEYREDGTELRQAV